MKNKKVKDLAMDEMKSYVSKKQNDFWVWTVVLDKNIKFFKVGKRNEESFFELESKLPRYQKVHTDGLSIYQNLRNREVKKFGLTNWNEGLHSVIRDKLAMFRRKTKAYAKSIRAMERALALLFIYWNFLPMDL